MFLALFLVLFVSGIAAAFTWEGELDPNEFDKWKFKSMFPSPQGWWWVMVANPDESSPIDAVALLVDNNKNVLGYRYFKDGEPYGYFFDPAIQKYTKHEYTAEQRKDCMGCHEGKVVKKTSI